MFPKAVVTYVFGLAVVLVVGGMIALKVMEAKKGALHKDSGDSSRAAAKERRRKKKPKRRKR